MVTEKSSAGAGFSCAWTHFTCYRPRLTVAVAFSVALLGCLFASRLEVHSDFADLLPGQSKSVQQLNALRLRSHVPATLMIGIESDSPQARDAAARELDRCVHELDPSLVSEVTFNFAAKDKYIWEHRFLFASLEELTDAKRALENAAHATDPLDLGLDDDENVDELSKLETELASLKQAAESTEGIVSSDKRLQLILVRSPFSSGDLSKGNQLLSSVRRIMSQVESASGGNLSIGLAGDIVSVAAEQAALVKGMTLATLATVALVLLALWWFYRSLLAVCLMLASLGIGVAVTFGVAEICIGHLNLASAFLSSIVIGNGINFGIILLSRYFEERRAGLTGREAVTAAVAGAKPGTVIAGLTAVVAYGSLAATPFRGFRDFGIIGGVGMALCWVSTFAVLPPLLVLFEGGIDVWRQPNIGRWLAKLWFRNGAVVASVVFALIACGTTGVLYFLTHEPLENDMRNLASDIPTAAEQSFWMDKFDRAFGHGISGGFVVATGNRDEAKLVAEQMRNVDSNKPLERHLFSQIKTLDDLVPDEQVKKLAVLNDIRRTLDTRILPHADPSDQQRLLRLRPPDSLRALISEDVPQELAWPFVERDGSRGKLILANNGLGVNSWDLRSLTRFVDRVRAMQLPKGVLFGGSAFVFADVLEAMRRDGPRTTTLSLLGSTLVVYFFAGRRRHAWVTLLSAWLGTLLMLAAMGFIGIKINFLDFVALPITIGIGVDYSVNLAMRARQEREHSGRRALEQTGGAVLLCSYTTIVGYASLLLSVNMGIRSFGTSAIIGEITCLLIALLITPKLLEWRRGECSRQTRSAGERQDEIGGR